MRSRLEFLLLFAACSLLPATLMAQIPSSPSAVEMDARTQLPQARKIIAGKVSTPRGDPVIHAAVEVTSNGGVPIRFLQSDNDGEFHTEYNFFNEQDARHLTVTLKVTKKGFQAAHKITEMGESVHNVSMAITLRPLQQEDPMLLSQDDLIKAVAPRLRQPGPADGLPAKEEKDYARGVQEFLDRNRVDRAVPYFAKVANLNPSCLKCRTMLALAELSWGDWDDARNELAESINALLGDRRLGSPEPLLAYGVLLSWGHEPAKAEAYFMEALKHAPQDALALQELGRVQCMALNWYDGSESLKKAVAAGAGPEARLMRAEALVWIGSLKEATGELKLYLNGQNPKSMPPRIQKLWARIQEGKKDETIIAAAKAKAEARGEAPLDYLHHPPRNLPDFEPATDQAPLKAVLAAVGKNVAELFADLPSICSVERVHHEKLSRNGKTESAQEYHYRYLAMAPNHPWGPSIDEYRGDSQGKASPQMGLSDNSMLTEGFVSAPLVFHPAYQNGSSFRLLGRQKVKDRRTYVIAYAQEPAKTSLSGLFQYGSTTRTTYTQGIAWIDPENYQIIRLASDLLRPLPQVRLEKETTEIDFSEVHFKQLKQTFWLPEAVTVTLNWNGRFYRNNHAYSDFLLSNVESIQRIGKPKGMEKTVEKVKEPQPGNSPLENHSLSLVPGASKP